jgi:hypothetical protein
VIPNPQATGASLVSGLDVWWFLSSRSSPNPGWFASRGPARFWVSLSAPLQPKGSVTRWRLTWRAMVIYNMARAPSAILHLVPPPRKIPTWRLTFPKCIPGGPAG